MTLFSQALTKINGVDPITPSAVMDQLTQGASNQFGCKLFELNNDQQYGNPINRSYIDIISKRHQINMYYSSCVYAIVGDVLLLTDCFYKGIYGDEMGTPSDQSILVICTFISDFLSRIENNKKIIKDINWDKINREMPSLAVRCAKHLGVNISSKDVETIYGNYLQWWNGSRTEQSNKQLNINSNEYTTMDKITRTELKNVLKSKGVTKQWEQAAIMVFGSNPERYLDLVESIYAISRVIPAVESDSVREKMDKANREWIKLVVDKDFCPQLKSYTDQYGRELVKLAILDLMDNGLWETPVGNKGLKNKLVSNYDGLQMLPEAIEKVKGEMPECKEHEQEQEEPIELQVETMIAPDEQHIETDSSKRKSAINSLKTMKDYMDIGLQNLTCLLDYLEKEDMVSLYEQENEQLRQQLAKKDADLAKAREQAIDAHDNLIADFEKEIQAIKDDIKKADERAQKEMNEKIEDVKNAKAQLKIAHKNVADLKDQLYVETNELRKQLKEMTDKYNDLSQQHDKLKELAKNATTPTCIIRFSELTGIDYIGRAAATQFVNFMEKRTKLVQFDKNK